MKLKDVQQVLAQVPDTPGSATAALRQLRQCADKALDYLDHGNTVQAQAMVEQGFTTMMSVLHYLNIDLELLVKREQARRKQANMAQDQDRAILVFSDHAELRVNGELRGTIPLYSPEDYEELRHIAQLFQCRMEHADHLQLTLFGGASSPSREVD